MPFDERSTPFDKGKSQVFDRRDSPYGHGELADDKRQEQIEEREPSPRRGEGLQERSESGPPGMQRILRLAGGVLALGLLVVLTFVNFPDSGDETTFAADQEAPAKEFIQAERTPPVKEEQPEPEPQQQQQQPPPPREVNPVEVPNSQEVLTDVADDLDLSNQELETTTQTTSNASTSNQQTTANQTSSGPPSQGSSEVFQTAEQMPQPVGGIQAIQQSVEYPQQCRDAGVQGRVIVRFVVSEGGQVQDPNVVRGIGAGCDQAAVRAVEQTEFEPGQQGGRPVNVRMTVPINFSLEQ